MIVILSSITGELTTDKVIDWLRFYKKDFIRFNGYDFINDHEFIYYIDNDTIAMKNNAIDWDKVKVIWYRRWLAGDEFESFLNLKSFDLDTRSRIRDFSYSEIRSASSIMFNKLRNKIFNNPNDTPKAAQLEVARKVGLTIPKTIITSNKKELLRFFKICNSKVITKCIGNVVSFEPSRGKNSYSTYTVTVDKDDIIIGEDNFSISLFQEFLDKDVEIRSFLLAGKIYSMAIFSTFNKQTKVDFRRYPTDKPNRNVPFKLPVDIEDKLLEFAKILNYNNGSFDLILTKEGKFVFLELNPDGQFGMVSTPCNYFLEREFAKELIKKLD